jgi:hypothetical protein
MKIGKSMFNKRMNESVQQQKASEIRPRKRHSFKSNRTYTLYVPKKIDFAKELAQLKALLLK